MATPLRSRNAVLLVKTEVTAGTFTAPSASTDAIKVANPSIDINHGQVEANDVTGSLDSSGPIPIGAQCTIGFDVYLKGSGLPGVAPEWGETLKLCGYSETATLTAIGPLTTISFNATGSHILDSGSGLGALTVGTVLHVAGAANSANNGEFLVATAAAGDITVTKADGSAAGLVTESAGASITIRYGVAAVAATAGTTITFTAQTPWGNTLQQYQGMPVLLSGNPATPAWSFIADYTAARVGTIADLMGSALTTSTKISIPAHVLYRPVSQSIGAGSVEVYMDGLRYRFRGCRGTAVIRFPTNGLPMLQVRLSGLFEGKADAAVPTPTYDGSTPGVFRGSKMLYNRIAVPLREFSVDSGANVVFPTDPNDTEGYIAPLHQTRQMVGVIDPYASLIAGGLDILSDLRGGTERIIHGRVLGGAASVAGNRSGLTVPRARALQERPQDDGGLLRHNANFYCAGQDAGSMLAIY